MEVWYLLNERTKVKLSKLYRKLSGCEYIPPGESNCVLRVSLEIGDTEEADRQMRIASKVKWRPR